MTFLLAAAVVVIWAATGPTVVTFLMVFLIQNTQNRDTEAPQPNRIRDNYTKLARAARENIRRGGQDTGRPVVDD